MAVLQRFEYRLRKLEFARRKYGVFGDSGRRGQHVGRGAGRIQKRRRNAGVNPFPGRLSCRVQFLQIRLRLRDQLCFVVAAGTQVHSG